MPKKKNAVRKDGRIAVQVYIGRGNDGKRKYKTVYGFTQKEADEKALQVKLSMRKGLDVSAQRDTFGEWAERWYNVKMTEVSLSQSENYRYALKYLKSAVGDLPISKVRTADIQDVIMDLAANNPTTKRPTSKRTLKYVKDAAAQVFRLAIESRVLDYNPVIAVKIPASAPERSRRALTEGEQGWVTETPHSAQRAAMIMMYAGLRKGEVIALMRSDIDLKERTIRVNKSAEKIGGKYVVKASAKTAAGMRTVDIPHALVDFLSRETFSGLYACPTTTGAIHTESSWKSMWNSYLADLNIKYGDFSRFEKRPKSKFDPKGVPFVIPRITPHWLRHTFATLLYFAGVDVLTARAQLGHSDIRTTLGIYTHLDAEHKRKSMDALDKYLEGASRMQVK